MKHLLALRAPIAGLSRLLSPPPKRKQTRPEWGAYLGSFGDDFFSDD